MNKIPRFMKEYATFIIESIRTNELMLEEIKVSQLEQLRKALKAYENGLITTNETMSILSSI